MIVSVQEARKILGRSGREYTDQQVEEIINLFVAISDFAIDSYLEKKRRGKEVEADAANEIDFNGLSSPNGKKNKERKN